MFIKTKHYDNCIQKVRIEVGTLVGLEADDEAYIVLKELPTLEMLRLKEASEQGENQTLTLLRDLLPSILVDHNFYEDADAKKKMDNREVASLVFESLDLTVKVVNEYTHAAFFSRADASGARSRPSAARSSTDDVAPSSTASTATGSST
ncbi:MAG: hypothetical protein CVV48_15455 [Spirochaetae bacterium HGW-Spirochaetae-4]|nr:MAG: hypothetical protein CVV48_15455 [Spirochaetae bacterium HGW-Spirochaetae-4]